MVSKFCGGPGFVIFSRILVDSTQCVLVIVSAVVIAPTMTAMVSTRPFSD